MYGSIQYIKGTLALGPYGQAPSSHGRPPLPETLGLPQLGSVAEQEGHRSPCIHGKPVHGSVWKDALQRKDLDAAIASFWLCKFEEI